MVTTKTPRTIDEYISSFPPDIQGRLNDVRKVVKKYAPNALEKISYGMPAYTQEGMLLYFAAHKNHIGLYPLTSAIEAFTKELSDYNCSKGTIQFPNDEPLPLHLIAKITAFRVNENSAKALTKVRREKNR